MKLLEIQEKISAALSAVEALKGVPVVVEDKGDVQSRVNTAIGQATRCILIQTPGFKPTSSASKVIPDSVPGSAFGEEKVDNF